MVIRREFNSAGREEARLAKKRSRRQTGRMPRTLDHLPAGKRDELRFVVEVLTESFDQERSTRWAQHLKNGAVLRIILYGSYARGDWVEDPVGRYFSDYDLLVVVADERHADVLEFWAAAEKRLLAELSSGERLRTPVNFIVHTQAEVDDALTRGRYFFMDIMADGIVLLEAPDAPAFAEPQPLAPDVALAETQAVYEDWIPSAERALKGARFYIAEGDFNDAAFLLHQAAERLYNGVLLGADALHPQEPQPGPAAEPGRADRPQPGRRMADRVEVPEARLRASEAGLRQGALLPALQGDGRGAGVDARADRAVAGPCDRPVPSPPGRLGQPTRLT
ncbi:MAG: HEPN domain-containing protein [Caulobacteraceae bacterium]|nr:HEPN domain-containing protein [Caulobacteraceae bacterium]MBX9802009.1 HEPN domain-containing protein [Caulobacteraceae bacterium]